MQPLPHHYDVTVAANETGPVEIRSAGLSLLPSAPPREFGGPGDLWSPETLTVAAVADCLALTFRAIATLSNLKWTNLVCDAQGTVDRSEGVIRFTGMRLRVRLTVPTKADAEKSHRVFQKAEKACLVGNSLKCEETVALDVTVVEPALAPSA
jgi:organic hydroperoxide reductase OsmC/OhrA